MSEEVVSQYKAVFFTYSIADDRGQVLEQVDLPVGYIHGANSRLVEKVETALTGAKVGDRIKVHLSPEEGFGQSDPNLTFTDDLENVPPEFHRVGAEVEMQNDAGEVKTFIVSKIENGKLTVDGNHPLAGKNTIYTVNIFDIRDASAAEIANGRPDDQNPMVH